MATSRKPTSLGIPAPVPPAATVPLRHKPPTLDLETPSTIDRGLLVEHTAIDDEEEQQQKFVPEPGGNDTAVAPEPGDAPDGLDGLGVADPADPEPLEAERWEEHSTVAEKSSSRRSLPALAPLPPAPRGRSSVPLMEALSPVTSSVREDSARVLVDFDDSRIGGPTGVDENGVASMPTAINPSASGTPSPVGITSLGEGRLVVIGGSDRGREFLLPSHETTLGRGADNDIILTDIAVSRRHIVLFTEGSRFGVRDLSSGNGTLLNGVRIAGDVFVHDGNQLELGNTLIRFEQADAFSSVGAPPVQPASGVVLGGGLVPLGGLGLGAPLPLPGVAPSGGRIGAPLTAPFAARGITPLPLSAQVFAPAGGEVPAPAPPHPSYAPEASSSGFVPIGPHTGPVQPSAGAMDLLRTQRKLILTLGASVVGVSLLLWIVVRVASQPDKKGAVVSTEAATSPALSALLADVDKPEATLPVDDPPAAAVASTPPAPNPPRVDLAPPKAAPVPPVTRLTPRPKAAPARPVKRPVAVKPAPTVGSAAERSAITLYKGKDFNRAADLLHTAAAKESGATADRLEALARDFAQVGAQLAKGDAAAAANPTVALAAYKQAYLLDAKSGKGVHAPYLKTQLGKVLPRAASSFMSTGKFEQARGACDDAAQFGSAGDPTVNKVRNLLEGKAKELYTQGTTLARSRPDEAKGLWRRVLKMVPAESPWYSKSYAALNKSQKSSGQDEDE